MTMEFRNLKTSIVSLLGTAAAGQFRVYGYQTQPKGAIEFLGTNRSVRVFYSGGLFPKSSASERGPFDHNMTFSLELIVVEQSSIDLSVIEDPDSTALERAAAIAAKTDAAELADNSFDEFSDLLFQILMNAENQDLGLVKYTVGSRWVDEIKKYDPNAMGEYVILTGKVTLSCSLEEIVSGATATDGELISGDINEIDGDTKQQTGIDTDI